MNLHVSAPDLCSDGDLIDVETACSRTVSYVTPITEVESVTVHQAGGRTLAEEVVATLAMPAFDQSAMDGYAVALSSGSLSAASILPIHGRVAAGDVAPALSAGHAAR